MNNKLFVVRELFPNVIAQCHRGYGAQNIGSEKSLLPLHQRTMQQNQESEENTVLFPTAVRFSIRVGWSKRTQWDLSLGLCGCKPNRSPGLLAHHPMRVAYGQSQAFGSSGKWATHFWTQITELQPPIYTSMFPVEWFQFCAAYPLWSMPKDVNWTATKIIRWL